MRILGLVSLVIAVIILVLGVISPLNIIICTIVAALLFGFGAFALLKARKSGKDAD